MVRDVDVDNERDQESQNRQNRPYNTRSILSLLLSHRYSNRVRVSMVLLARTWCKVNRMNFMCVNWQV